MNHLTEESSSVSLTRVRLIIRSKCYWCLCDLGSGTRPTLSVRNFDEPTFLIDQRLKNLEERFIKSNSGNQGYFNMLVKISGVIRTRLECG